MTERRTRAPQRVRRALFVCAALLAACGGTGGNPPADARSAAASAPTVTCGAATASGGAAGSGADVRALRDCAAERAGDAAADLRLGERLAAASLSEPDRRRVDDALALLGSELERACRDWNACAAAPAEFRRRSDALAARRTELLRLTGDVERGGDARALVSWADAVLTAGPLADPAEAERAARDRVAAERIASLREQQADSAEASAAEYQRRLAAADAQTSVALAAAREQIRTTVAQLERHAAEHEAFAALVVQVRAAYIDADATVPPGCRDQRVLEAVRITALGGGAAAAAAEGLARDLGSYCDRFHRWEAPDERARRAIGDYFDRLARVRQWMTELRACRDATGRDAQRCRNTYTNTDDEAAEEAAQILVMLAEHERELVGVRAAATPFPCTTPVLDRIAATARWKSRTAEAQMPTLPQQADRVCATIGVDPVGLRNARRELSRTVDQLESNARARRRQHLESIVMMRAQLQDP